MPACPSPPRAPLRGDGPSPCLIAKRNNTVNGDQPTAGHHRSVSIQSTAHGRRNASRLENPVRQIWRGV